MKLITNPLLTSLIAILVCTTPAIAQDEYKQPYPHTTGAQLLPYCQNVEIVVDQLKCDFYMQAMFDLASTPVAGVRLACPPRGMNRSELIAFAVEQLSAAKPADLESSSAASLLLRGLRKEFRCPRAKQPKGKQGRGMGKQQGKNKIAGNKAAVEEPSATKELPSATNEAPPPTEGAPSVPGAEPSAPGEGSSAPVDQP